MGPIFVSRGEGCNITALLRYHLDTSFAWALTAGPARRASHIGFFRHDARWTCFYLWSTAFLGGLKSRRPESPLWPIRGRGGIGRSIFWGSHLNFFIFRDKYILMYIHLLHGSGSEKDVSIFCKGDNLSHIKMACLWSRQAPYPLWRPQGRP